MTPRLVQCVSCMLATAFLAGQWDRGGEAKSLAAEVGPAHQIERKWPAESDGRIAGGAPLFPKPPSDGPWNHDVLVYRISASGEVAQTATFERAGVATIARIKDGRLVAAHQYFPENDAANFDKVAVRFCSDEGRTWTAPRVIRLTGLPEGMRFPFDPTLVPLPDGRIRLYFTSLRGRRFEEDVPAIHSAISANGVDYTFEPGVRFGIEGRIVIDCAVALHRGVFHLYAPDNGLQRRPGERPGQEPAAARPRPGVGYHATSNDGLKFTRVEDVRIEGRRRWLGGAQSDGKAITFIGTGEGNGQGGGGIWMATGTDGQSWHLASLPPIPGADPGAVRASDGGWIVVSTGPPRSGPRRTPEREPRSDERDRRTEEALLAQARQAVPERYRFALQQGAHIRPTPDGRSFYLVWFPKDSPRANRPPVIVGLHGSESWAFDELFLWQPYAAQRGYGVVAVQWWLGGRQRLTDYYARHEGSDYYAPREIYPILEKALREEGVAPGRSLIHGFSRGSANLYAVMALDRQRGGNFFRLAVANAGGVAADFPPTAEIGRGVFGAKPFADTHWVMFCGGRDPNPDRDGCPAMRRSRDWVARSGGEVELFIEDAAADHGGFHKTPSHVNAALDVFARLLRAGPDAKASAPGS